MNYYGLQWIRWADRLVVVVSIACLCVGMSVARAQTSVPPGNDDRIERSPPVPVVTYSDPRGNAVTVIESDGGIRFDYGATVSWSRYFVAEAPPAKCRSVWVLTYINGPGARRPLWLQGCEPVQEKAQ